MASKDTEKTKETPNTQKFSVEELREHNLDVFGVTKPVFDGATCGLTGKYTVEKIKSVIKEWQNKEVK